MNRTILEGMIQLINEIIGRLNKNARKGFTLVEVLIVIIIIEY